MLGKQQGKCKINILLPPELALNWIMTFVLCLSSRSDSNTMIQYHLIILHIQQNEQRKQRRLFLIKTSSPLFPVLNIKDKIHGYLYPPDTRRDYPERTRVFASSISIYIIYQDPGATGKTSQASKSMQYHQGKILIPGVTLITPDETKSVLQPSCLLEPVPDLSDQTGLAPQRRRPPVPNSSPHLLENDTKLSVLEAKPPSVQCHSYSPEIPLSALPPVSVSMSTSVWPLPSTTLLSTKHFSGTSHQRKAISRCHQSISTIVETIFSFNRIRSSDVAEESSKRATGFAWTSIDKVVNKLFHSPPPPTTKSMKRKPTGSSSNKNKKANHALHQRPLPLRTSGYTPTRVTTLHYTPLLRHEARPHDILSPVPWSAKRGTLRSTTGGACLHAASTCPVQTPFDAFHYPLPTKYMEIECMWLDLVARKGWDLSGASGYGGFDIARKWGAVYADAKERFVRENKAYWEEVWMRERGR